MTTEQVEGVLICGAGPVGLITALGLAQRGIPVTLLDAEPGVHVSPRAMTYTEPTLRVFRKLQLMDDVERVGIRNYEIQFRWPADKLIVSIDPAKSLINPAFDYNLHFGQEALAEVIVAHLEKMPNVEIRWSARLHELRVEPNAVIAGVSAPEGEQSLHADWMVATDGGRSTVRRLLEIPFEGITWPDRFVATNVYCDFEKYGYSLANMICDPVDWAVVAKINGKGLWRVTFGEDSSLPEEEVLRRIPAHYDVLLPFGEPFEFESAAPYRVHERACTRFREGRVVLAGDAAHICNPCGGRGLTGGVMDADVLIETLSSVLNDGAGESILDDYAQERRRVFLEESSPFASMIKRMLSEPDSAKRRETQEAMKKRPDLIKVQQG